jgi:putative tricarboxylic transport membrane protein
VLGLLGVLMALAKVPVAPAIVGLILGPMFEEQALRAVLLEGGSISGLFSTTLSIVLWLIALLALIAPVVLAARRSRATAAEENQPVSQ